MLLLETWTAHPTHTVALHVNHQLQEAASQFEAHCRDFCAARNITLHVARVQATPPKGMSPEEAARNARYQALSQMALTHNAHKVLLAQHADDQNESILLAMSRGAGLRGLSGMAPRFWRHGVQFERPLLARRAAEIRSQLHHLGIPFLIDPTNANPAYTRNRIRLSVQPALEAAFAQWVPMACRSARHIAQAQELLDQLAHIDCLHVGIPPRTQKLRELGTVSSARLSNVLRHWLAMHHYTAPSTAQLEELCKQIMAARTHAHQIRLRIGKGNVQRVLPGNMHEPDAGDMLEFVCR